MSTIKEKLAAVKDLMKAVEIKFNSEAAPEAVVVKVASPPKQMV